MPKFQLKHQTHLETVLKFILLSGILALYFVYLIHRYDVSKGGITLALTWSFFVLCTPVADAGFLLDFPIRLLFGFRMFVIEIFVWCLAITIVLSTLLLAPTYFETTLITRVLHHVLTHPMPYWAIIFLSCMGTFASIYFGDEMMDVVTHDKRVTHHKHGFKYRAIALVGVTLLVVAVYYQLITDLNIPLTAEQVF